MRFKPKTSARDKKKLRKQRAKRRHEMRQREGYDIANVKYFNGKMYTK